MLQRDNREIVNTCDHLTSRVNDAACGGPCFGRDQRARNQYCTLVQMCRAEIRVARRLRCGGDSCCGTRDLDDTGRKMKGRAEMDSVLRQSDLGVGRWDRSRVS